MKDNFYKKTPQSKIWWVDDPDVRGEFVFSFDKKKKYNLFEDYPHNMSESEIKIFDDEEPFWKNFFNDRR